MTKHGKAYAAKRNVACWKEHEPHLQLTPELHCTDFIGHGMLLKVLHCSVCLYTVFENLTVLLFIVHARSHEVPASTVPFPVVIYTCSQVKCLQVLKNHGANMAVKDKVRLLAQKCSAKTVLGN